MEGIMYAIDAVVIGENTFLELPLLCMVLSPLRSHKHNKIKGLQTSISPHMPYL